MKQYKTIEAIEKRLRQIDRIICCCTGCEEGVGGQLNYESYVAQLIQDNMNTDDPREVLLEGLTGITITWTRNAAGEYFGAFSIPPTYTNIYVSGLMSNSGNPDSGRIAIPIESSDTIIGYYEIFVDTVIELRFYDSTWVLTDMYDLVGIHYFNLPEIRFYNIP